MTSIQGTVAPGFEPVRDAFAENVRSRNELGAACAVVHRGELVVDLWGGYRDLDRQYPWEEDTIVFVFSATKGMTAAATAVALSRGLFDLDDRIADHWPEFAQHGKGEITVRQLLAHQAGLAGLDRRLTPEDIADPDRLAEILAAQTPDWDPGTRNGYHAFTLGWCLSELLRRTDGRTMGQFFAEEVAETLDADFSVGLPADTPAHRVAELDTYGLVDMLRNLDTMPWRLVLGMLYPGSVANRALRCLDTDELNPLADPAFRPVEMPSANGLGTARAMATVYGDLATGGHRLGIDEAVFAELTAMPSPPSNGRRDLVIAVETAYTMGFSKPYGPFQFGSSSRAFGTPGAGGSFGFADPDAELGFAYVPNRMGVHLKDDPREVALREAVYECLAETDGQQHTPSDERVPAVGDAGGPAGV